MPLTKDATTSAVILCHNYGRFLSACLESVIRQTRPFDEILLLDDDSTDETHSVWSSSYSDCVRYEKVRYHSQMPVRNHGFRATQGEFFVCIDADDWIDPQFHEYLFSALRADSEAGFAYCDFEIHRESGEHPWFMMGKRTTREFDAEALWISNYCPATSLVRRSAWCGQKRAFGYTLESGRTYLEDWDLWLEMADAGWRGKLVDQKLLHYRIHGENTSKEPLLRRDVYRRAIWAIRESHLRYDLTLVFLRRDPGKPVQASYEFLQRLKKPANTQILFLDAKPETAERPPDFLSYFVVPEGTVFWRRLALEQARQYSRGKRVVILSDSDLSRCDLSSHPTRPAKVFYEETFRLAENPD